MRKITSLILLIAGFIELVTGVVLYIIPAGRVAYWSNYHLMGIDKHQWGDIHITVGFLLVLVSLIHLYLNWKAIVAYLKNKAKKLVVFNASFSIALAVSLYVAIGTLFHLPPMNFVLAIGEHFTEKGNEKYGEPPYGHAELSSLKMFCSKMNLDLVKAKALLISLGFEVVSGKDIIADIAAKNGRRPQEIYEIIKCLTISNEGASFPSTPMPGFGIKSIKDICRTYGLPLKEVLEALKAAGIEALPDDTVKDAASSSGKNPMSIFEVLKVVADDL